MCPAGTPFSHQHRKPNLKWISSLSESDRLEIHLRFVFGQRAPSTMLVTAGVSTPASPPYNIIRAKRCESPIIWNLLSVILLRDESERVRTESERSQKKSYWFVETYRANGFWPQSEASPNGVRTSPKSQIPIQKKLCSCQNFSLLFHQDVSCWYFFQVAL